MNLDFTGEIIYWRGPAPFLFVAVPQELSDGIKAISSSVTYGWGVIPVCARIGGKAASENCQMLCKDENRRKSGK